MKSCVVNIYWCKFSVHLQENQYHIYLPEPAGTAPFAVGKEQRNTATAATYFIGRLKLMHESTCNEECNKGERLLTKRILQPRKNGSCALARQIQRSVGFALNFWLHLLGRQKVENNLVQRNSKPKASQMKNVMPAQLV
ncbi:hypothetical protein HRG84_23165 [Flavisolibacter sp. BT320]|nr:hypothetical protein [Flavisolibacter longurius]